MLGPLCHAHRIGGYDNDTILIDLGRNRSRPEQERRSRHLVVVGLDRLSKPGKGIAGLTAAGFDDR
jgi:hypothetical protein